MAFFDIKYDEKLYIRLKRLLEHSGWDIDDPNQYREYSSLLQTAIASLPQAALLRDGKPYLAIFPLDSEYSVPYSNLVAQYIDLTPTFKECIKSARGLGMPYALIISLRQAYIYKTAEEEALLYSQSAIEFRNTILPEIKKEKITEDHLSKIIMRSDEERGKALSEWVTLWSNKLGTAAEFSKLDMEQFFNKILIVYQFEASEIYFDKKVLPLCELENVSDIENPFNFKSIFSYYKDTYNIEICRIEMRGGELYKRLSERRLLLKKFFAELCLLSKSKFSFGVFMSAFGDRELCALSWKISLTTKLGLTEHFSIDANVVHNPVIVDLNEIGYGGVMMAIEELFKKAANYNRTLRKRLKEKQRVEIQLDILTALSSTIDLKSGIIKNIVDFIFEKGIRIKVNKVREQELLKLLIYSRLIELIKERKIHKLEHFPSLDKVFISVNSYQ